MKGFFITGTDTNVGKTYVTAALARRGVLHGHQVLAFKPIETGCSTDLGPDQAELCRAAGGWQQGELRGLYQFVPPVAPLVAADAAGVTVDLDRISGLVETALADLKLVEGAGGWRVPITRSEDMSGLARRLGFPVLVVSRAGLGTINHTLLTLEAVRCDGCEVAGVVMSERPEDEPGLTQSNVEQIRQRWDGQLLVLGKDPSVLDALLG